MFILIFLLLLAVVCYYLMLGWLLLSTTKVRPRFSLQSLLFFVLWGGTCASFLHDPARELLFAYGVVGIILFFAFFISYIITQCEAAVAATASTFSKPSALAPTSEPASDPESTSPGRAK